MSDDPRFVVASGERGATGDHGQTGERGLTGETGSEGVRGGDGIEGPRGLTGIVQHRNPLVAILFTLCVLSGLVVVGAALWVAGKEADNAEQQSIEAGLARRELVVVRGQLAAIADDRAEEQIIEDCRNLYQEDVDMARIARDIEEGRLFATVVAIPADATELERREVTSGAVADLNQKDANLRSAAQAFDGYASIVPAPIDCPHPQSK